MVTLVILGIIIVAFIAGLSNEIVSYKSYKKRNIIVLSVILLFLIVCFTKELFVYINYVC